MSQKTNIISLKQVREKKQKERRKNYQRLLFQTAMSSYIVLSAETMKSIHIMDVSSEGIGWYMPVIASLSAEIQLTYYPIRLYFAPSSYIEIFVNVMYAKQVFMNGQSVIRYGAKVDQNHKSYFVYKAFFDFLKAYSEAAHIEKLLPIESA